MKKRLFSLVAAAGLVGLVATAQAGGLTPMPNSSLASVSAQGVNINQTSNVNLSGGAQASAAGFVIANMAGTAANDQVNVNAQLSVQTSRFAPRQINNGLAINDVQLAYLPTTDYEGSGYRYADFEYFNIAHTSGHHYASCSLTNAEAEFGSGWHNTYKAFKNNKTSVSGVSLSSGAQANATGLVIANMSSSAANNQINLNAQGRITGGTIAYDHSFYHHGSRLAAPAFVPYQINNGVAINNVGTY